MGRHKWWYRDVHVLLSNAIRLKWDLKLGVCLTNPCHHNSDQCILEQVYMGWSRRVTVWSCSFSGVLIPTNLIVWCKYLMGFIAPMSCFKQKRYIQLSACVTTIKCRHFFSYWCGWLGICWWFLWYWVGITFIFIFMTTSWYICLKANLIQIVTQITCDCSSSVILWSSLETFPYCIDLLAANLPPEDSFTTSLHSPNRQAICLSLWLCKRLWW